MNLDKTIEFYEFLQGEIPEGFSLRNPPKLSPNEAFSIIYILQEYFDLIPDHFEKCERCDELFDMELEGDHFDDPGIDLCGMCAGNVFWRWANGEEDNMEEVVKEWYKNRSSVTKVNRGKNVSGEA